MMVKPLPPENPCFSSGPTAKFKGWENAFFSFVDDYGCVGRSHRSGVCKNILQEIINLNREILGIPKDYLVGILPASDTGAFETALWNFISPEYEVHCYYCGSFGKTWYNDLKNQLKARVKGFGAPYGEIFQFEKIKKNVDVVIVWNETTSGVVIPIDEFNNFIDNHQELVFIDATSALFAMDFPWQKADVVSWSPQKCLGGEAAFGMLALSPKAVSYSEGWTSRYFGQWPKAKIMNLVKDGKLLKDPFEANTINTVSMLSALDFLLSLKWAKKYGLNELIERTYWNYRAIETWVNKTEWIDFLVSDKNIRSTTSVTLKIVDKRLRDGIQIKEKVNELVRLLEEEKMAYDIKAYRDAPSGLRIWCGPTVEKRNLERLTACLDWGWDQVVNNN